MASVCSRFSQVTFAITGAVHATASAKKKCQLKKNKRPQSYWKVQQKLLQDKLAQSSGKVILLKDLSNLKAKSKAGNTRNNLEAAVKQLMDKHGESCLHKM